MMVFVLALLRGVTNFFKAFLPQSPVQQFANDPTHVLPETALGWLNWFVPVQGMLGLFTAWLAAGLVWMTVRFVKRNTFDRIVGVKSLTGN